MPQVPSLRPAIATANLSPHTLALLTLLIAFLLTPLSTPIWHHLPNLAYLQFPWRLLTLLTPILALAIALLLDTRNRHGCPIRTRLRYWDMRFAGSQRHHRPHPPPPASPRRPRLPPLPPALRPHRRPHPPRPTLRHPPRLSPHRRVHTHPRRQRSPPLQQPRLLASPKHCEPQHPRAQHPPHRRRTQPHPRHRRHPHPRHPNPLHPSPPPPDPQIHPATLSSSSTSATTPTGKSPRSRPTPSAIELTTRHIPPNDGLIAIAAQPRGQLHHRHHLAPHPRPATTSASVLSAPLALIIPVLQRPHPPTIPSS